MFKTDFASSCEYIVHGCDIKSVNKLQVKICNCYISYKAQSADGTIIWEGTAPGGETPPDQTFPAEVQSDDVMCPYINGLVLFFKTKLREFHQQKNLLSFSTWDTPKPKVKLTLLRFLLIWSSFYPLSPTLWEELMFRNICGYSSTYGHKFK